MHQSSPCLCSALRKASRAVTRLYDERIAGSGMTITQFSILRNLSRDGDVTLSRLAELLVMDRTSLYRTIEPVERHGWVTIARAARGPTRIARLTDAGRAAMDDATPAWEQAQTSMIEAIGASDWAALEAQLGRLVTAAHGQAL